MKQSRVTKGCSVETQSIALSSFHIFVTNRSYSTPHDGQFTNREHPSFLFPNHICHRDQRMTLNQIQHPALLQRLPHRKSTGQASCFRFRTPEIYGQLILSSWQMKRARTSFLHREGGKSLSSTHYLRELGRTGTCACPGRTGIVQR